MDSEKMNGQLIHSDELKNVLDKICQREQVYSIALFDVLGFSKLVSSQGNQVVLDLYNKLLDILEKQRTHYDGTTGFASSVVPMRVTEDWKQNIMVAEANGFINACHFSDTFLIYVNYEIGHNGFPLATPFNEPYPLLLGEVGTEYYPILYQRHNIYLSFLQTCMEFFCQAIVSGIPLRGCISTGLAIMDHTKSVYIGEPIVEAARGEPAQNSLGIAFGKSFNNSHPVYNKYFIPYLNHLKPDDNNTKFLSPMMLDWAKYWRESPDFKDYDFYEYINKMNTDEKCSSYYENAIKFFEFSKAHDNWASELNREEIKDMTDYYKRATEWFETVNHPTCKKDNNKMLYIAYLPKVKDESLAKRKVNNILAWYSKVTKNEYHVISAPGYLSTSEKTINDYIEGLSGIFKKGTSIGFLNGMNGHYKTSKGNTIIEAHNQKLHTNEFKQIKLQPKKEFDHRKMMCFYMDEKENTKEITIDTIDDFLENIYVGAILIGSSNQSKNTYFRDPADKGESDIFIFDVSRDNEVKSFIEKNLLGDMHSDYMSLLDDIVFTKSFYGNGHDNPQDFLKSILKDVLVSGLES